jgi:predicted MFS family arabinose efflux permease
MRVVATSERSIVFFVSAVQFVNILDFMMVMPLGPDFAKSLGIDVSHLGYIGGSYTAAAAISGLAGSLFLEKFDRRKALAVAMLGLVIGTALGGLAWDLPSLIAARIVAGLFGGPATSLALAIIADRVPPERRGRAMGAVMSAFAVASVLGVPAGLELARWGGWRMPFFAVAGLGLVVAAIGIRQLPPMIAHLEKRADEVDLPWRELFTRPVVLLAYLVYVAMFMSNFLVIPSISPYVQLNLHYPRANLSRLYLFGGGISFFVTRLTGRLNDRFGTFGIATFGCVSAAAVLWASFGTTPPLVPVWAIFMLFFAAMGFRNVPITTLMSMVPGPRERARFMSIGSAVQHMAAAFGAFLSSQVLVMAPDKTLHGMQDLAKMSITLTLLLPIVLWFVVKKVDAARTVAA